MEELTARPRRKQQRPSVTGYGLQQLLDRFFHDDKVVNRAGIVVKAVEKKPPTRFPESAANESQETIRS